jgi:hypothetical protein
MSDHMSRQASQQSGIVAAAFGRAAALSRDTARTEPHISARPDRRVEAARATRG